MIIKGKAKKQDIQYNLKRIKALALEITNNETVDVTPTAQAEIIVKKVDETNGLLGQD